MGVVAGVIGGIASGIGSFLGNKQAAKAQREATAAQERWRQEQLAQAQPYLDAGKVALEARSNLLGLNGEEAQTNALAKLSNDQNWQAQLDAINDNVTRNAVAKGQTGGNLLASLADRSQQYKYSQIQDYLRNLTGEVGAGTNALSQLGNVGTSAVNSISDSLGNAGLYTGSGTSNLFQGFGNALKAYQEFDGKKSATAGGI